MSRPSSLENLDTLTEGVAQHVKTDPLLHHRRSRSTDFLKQFVEDVTSPIRRLSVVGGEGRLDGTKTLPRRLRQVLLFNKMLIMFNYY